MVEGAPSHGMMPQNAEDLARSERRQHVKLDYGRQSRNTCWKGFQIRWPVKAAACKRFSKMRIETQKSLAKNFLNMDVHFMNQGAHTAITLKPSMRFVRLDHQYAG